jgi:small subunit ribosomal protein S6
MVIFDPTVDEKTVATSVNNYVKVIGSAGGTVDKIDIWGRRKMTFEINKHAEGIYAVINVTSGYEAVVELDRQLKLSESVLRTKVLRLEDAVFSINPVEFTPDARPPRAHRPSGKRPARTR